MRISDWSSDVCSSDRCLQGLKHEPGMFRFADQQVGQIDVLLVVDERLAVDAADVEARGESNRRRGAIVPFILPAGVQVRSEERRVGKEGVSTCRSRWSPYH